mgnify:CR=1 FL=1
MANSLLGNGFHIPAMTLFFALLLQLVAADLYAALGVSRDVDDRALKKAFGRKALQNHPDKQKAQSEEQKYAALAKQQQPPARRKGGAARRR